MHSSSLTKPSAFITHNTTQPESLKYKDLGILLVVANVTLSCRPKAATEAQ